MYIGKINKYDEESTYINDGIDSMNYQEGNTFHVYESKYNSSTPIQDNIGNSYRNYFTMFIDTYISYSDCWSYVEYPTNGQYSKFKATLGLTKRYQDTLMQNL